MDIIWTIIEGLLIFVFAVVGLVAVTIGLMFDIVFEVFRTIRYWIIKGMTAIVKKMKPDEDMKAVWNNYLDSVWSCDLVRAFKFDNLKFTSKEEEP